MTIFARSAVARADDGDTRVDDRVLLHVDVEGRVEVKQGKDFTVGCDAPCTLSVPRGSLQIITPSTSTDVFVTGESRVRLTAPSPAARTGGAIAVFGGIGIVVLAVALPLVFCVLARPDGSLRPDGTRVDDSVCHDVSDGVKVAWIAGGGVGLTAGIAGGIVYALAGQRLQLTEARSAPAPSVAVLPTLQLATGLGTRTRSERLAPGLALTMRF